MADDTAAEATRVNEVVDATDEIEVLLISGSAQESCTTKQIYRNGEMNVL